MVLNYLNTTMEDVYFTGTKGVHNWCSEKTNVKLYFNDYTQLISGILDDKHSEIDILQKLVPQSNQLTQAEMIDLEMGLKGDQLTTLLNNDLVKKRENHKGERPSLGHPFEPADNKFMNRIKKQKTSIIRREVHVDAAEKIGYRNLKNKDQFVLSFRIHEPYTHIIGDRNSRPGKCSQQVSVLGMQTLTHLCDAIRCEANYQDARGDMSERPDDPHFKLAQDVYCSNMFYIDNTFYIDSRHYKNIDYSKPIREWAANRDIKVGRPAPMESAKIQDLNVRFGYPYVYMHQGCCEHIVIVSDARLLTTKDSLYSQDYPLTERISCQNLTNCMSCSGLPAKWVVQNNDRLIHDPSFQCNPCFKLYNYVNGQRVGNFKAHHLFQRTTVIG